MWPARAAWQLMRHSLAILGGIGMFQRGFMESDNQYLVLRGYDPSSRLDT
jgi:hypothetical protein